MFDDRVPGTAEIECGPLLFRLAVQVRHHIAGDRDAAALGISLDGLSIQSGEHVSGNGYVVRPSKVDSSGIVIAVGSA